MFYDSLNWRYATKKYDSTRQVPQDKVDRILEAIRLTPTSSGLQPFEVIVVTNADLRTQIQAESYGQTQVSDSSHLLVFAAWDNYTAERIDEVVVNTSNTRGIPIEGVSAYYETLKGNYLPRPAEVNYQHAARQAYIAVGFALAAAAVEEVDSTPMEGFVPEKIDEILGLPARGLRSVVLLPLGYRATEGDWLAGMKKVRKSTERMISERA